MNYILVVFASVTTANRVKSVLRKKFGIDSIVVHTPKQLNTGGCSHCIKMKTEHIDTVWQIIVDNQLSSKGIYRDGDYARLR